MAVSEEISFFAQRGGLTRAKGATGDIAGLPRGAVFIDSPVVSALQQINPFFESGIFCRTETPLFLKKRLTVSIQLAFARNRGGLAAEAVNLKNITAMPVAQGGVVFYPFNSQSNLNAVTNRDVYHVLTLHGESNKSASHRPASRLYDYITAAGPLARDRYLDARIFSREEVDQGRLLLMGDSFVQSLPWIRPAQKDDDNPAIFYCPTWEGYGNGQDCYTSVTGMRGFHVLVDTIQAVKTNRVVVKPHPYLGLLKQSVLRDFVQGVRLLADSGIEVELALKDANLILRGVCRMSLQHVKRNRENPLQPLPVRLGLSDVSGMEAVMLKQRIHHMVITRASDIPGFLGDFYLSKTIQAYTPVKRAVTAYLDDAERTDAQHRSRVFGYQEPEVEMMDSAKRRAWLIDCVQKDDFWSRTGRR